MRRTLITVSVRAASTQWAGAANWLAARARRVTCVPGLRSERGFRREEQLRALAGEIGGEVEVCDSATAERSRRPQPRARAAPGRASARQQRRHARPRDPSWKPTSISSSASSPSTTWAACGALGALPGLKAAGGAHVVNVVSIAGAIAFARSGPYVAAKHAQLAFSRCLRPTLSRQRIAVHTVLPGFVQTEGFSQAALSRRRRSRWLVTNPVADRRGDRPCRRPREGRGGRALVSLSAGDIATRPRTRARSRGRAADAAEAARTAATGAWRSSPAPRAGSERRRHARWRPTAGDASWSLAAASFSSGSRPRSTASQSRAISSTATA